MQRPFGILIWPRTVICLEKLQRRSARFLKGDYRTTSSVSQMLHDLGWCDLKDRRRDLRLALLYMIVTGHVAINPDQIGLVAADNRTRANHRYKFRPIGASSTGLRYSFAVRTSQWLEPGLCCCCWAGESSCLQSSVGQLCACSHALDHYHY